MFQPLINIYEPPATFSKAVLSTCRLINTVIDLGYYNVPGLALDLYQRNALIDTFGYGDNLYGSYKKLDLSALTHPEGTVAIIDPKVEPYVWFPLTPDSDPVDFLRQHEDVHTISITGVASSALGSVAFAWDIATALDEPVLAIVPGFGWADMMSEGMAGYAFGLKRALRRFLQQYFNHATPPEVAKQGRHMSAKVREKHGEHMDSKGPAGSPEVAVLQALLKSGHPISRLIGHSKGSETIVEAIEKMPRPRRPEIITFGCAMAEKDGGTVLRQYLGLFDRLGLINSWGNPPDFWLPCTHRTNPAILGSMAVRALLGCK